MREAETVVQSCKAEYEKKVQELEWKRRNVERIEQSVKVDKELQQTLIREKAEAISKQDRENLENGYQIRVAGYKGVMLGSLLYGTLCTLFTAVRSKAFVSDCKAFLRAIWGFITMCIEKGGYVAKWASQLGDMIPQPTISIIVHWIILLFAVAVMIGAATILFGIGGVKLYDWYSEHCADLISLAEILISFAVLVFFAEPIREIVPVNLLFLLLLTHLLYIGIRRFIKGWKEARGFY